jgi:hypothetical protein
MIGAAIGTGIILLYLKKRGGAGDDFDECGRSMEGYKNCQKRLRHFFTELV